MTEKQIFLKSKLTRIVGLMVLIVVLMTGFSSCKKCHVCSVLDEESNAIYSYPEVCGTKKDLEAYEARCVAEYGAFDFTCACGEK
ncbi:MAG: hypothetical protein WEC59_06515 [Salibacteraceae bacterium]